MATPAAKIPVATTLEIAANDSEDSSVDGTYDMSTSILENNDDHPDRFSTASYTVSANGSTVTLQASGSGLSFSGTGNLDSNGNFSVSGNGTYAGFSTMFNFQGTFDPSTNSWSGEADVGTDGALPDSNDNGSNEPLRVMFQGNR